VDIRPSEKEILAAMKSKTRYNIRLADRKGVRVERGKREDIETFNHLMSITGERDDFGVRSAAYYRRVWELFEPLGMAHMLIARMGQEPIAALMAFACGKKAWYMYGASSNRHRETMPNYALQWEAIRWAKSRGCETYDLYGVPDQELETLESSFTERSDGLWGVYRFKRGFGGDLVRYAGAYDYVYRRSLYWLYHRLVERRSQMPL
jgi:lipid II:glycine glycyltransferase (peptidoglycan interpeptide bridge formation enzyme)